MEEAEYSDVNPERRNLVLTSAAFIAAYASGAHFHDQLLRLPMVDVRFTDPDALKFLAWIALYWFALRFWQATGSLYMEAFKEELQKYPAPSFIYPRLTAKITGATNLPGFDKKNPTPRLGALVKQSGVWTITSYLGKKKSGSLAVQHEAHEITGWRLFAFLAFLWVKVTVRENAGAQYLSPYLIFIIAATAPLWSRYI